MFKELESCKNNNKLSNMLKVGDFVKINENICSDVDVLDWLGEQSENKFKINHVELESNGVWIDGCDFRIEINECIVL